MNADLLITGITGFVGTSLTNTFHADWCLYGMDVRRDNYLPVKKNYSWAELSEIPEVDTIIHLAGKAHDTKSTSSAQEYIDINVGLTKVIFQYFLKSTATKFIFFSSVKAVADSVKGTQLFENEIPNPQTPYGKSKLEAERYILEEFEHWKNNIKPEGIVGENKHLDLIDKKIYILRPCMIHGPGNKGNLNLLFKLQQNGLPWPLGAFENKRSFCSIDNVSFIIRQLIENDIESGIYQIADDEALSTNRIIQLIAESQNKKSRIWHLPAGMIKGIARFGDFLHIPLNSERLKKLTESYVVSNLKIKTALCIEKLPIIAEDGLKKTFESFRK